MLKVSVNMNQNDFITDQNDFMAKLIVKNDRLICYQTFVQMNPLHDSDDEFKTLLDAISNINSDYNKFIDENIDNKCISVYVSQNHEYIKVEVNIIKKKKTAIAVFFIRLLQNQHQLHFS